MKCTLSEIANYKIEPSLLHIFENATFLHYTVILFILYCIHYANTKHHNCWSLNFANIKGLEKTKASRTSIFTKVTDVKL